MRACVEVVVGKAEVCAGGTRQSHRGHSKCLLGQWELVLLCELGNPCDSFNSLVDFTG